MIENRKGDEEDLDDKQIVELFLSRDENAIRESAAKYGTRLHALAYGIVTDRQTAEECEHDTYLEAWNRIPAPDDMESRIDDMMLREHLEKGGYTI